MSAHLYDLAMAHKEATNPTFANNQKANLKKGPGRPPKSSTIQPETHLESVNNSTFQKNSLATIGSDHNPIEKPRSQ
jgi:hypothetical protein